MLKRLIIIILGASTLSACQSETSKLYELCYQVMSKDAADGNVKIYNTGQAMPRETCQCFSKMEDSDDRVTSSLIFYDLIDVQRRNDVVADKVFDALANQIRQDGQIRIYGIEQPGGSVGAVYKLKSKVNNASITAGRGGNCK